MPKVKMNVQHTIRQTIEIDWPDDEMGDFDHDNALCNANFDESKPSEVVDSEFTGVWIGGQRHYF